ncbi:MAG: hypothetical protein WA816_03915 [Bacteroidales bacterium]
MNQLSLSIKEICIQSYYTCSFTGTGLFDKFCFGNNNWLIWLDGRTKIINDFILTFIL